MANKQPTVRTDEIQALSRKETASAVQPNCQGRRVKGARWLGSKALFQVESGKAGDP